MWASLRPSTDLGVRLNLEPAITQVAFASKGINGRGVVRPDFLLLCIVAYAHSDVVVARPTGGTHIYYMNGAAEISSICVPPDVERQFKTGYQDALIEFPGPIAQGMFAWRCGEW